MKNLKSLAILLILAVVGFANAHPSINSGKEKRFIKTSESEPAVWLTEEQIDSLIKEKVGFMDITDRKTSVFDKNLAPTKTEFPKTVRFSAVVNEALRKLSTERIESFIKDFSSFHNRHYESDTGVEATTWLIHQLQDSVKNNRDYSGNVTIRRFVHSWRQPSIIVRFEGTDPTIKSELVVLGAHLDSTAGGPSHPAPGADDNASGSAVLLETTRALLESNFIPKRSVEFQWYAAEEVGLRGSQDIAQAYTTSGINVISMVNFDVVGYFIEGRNEISLLTDYTDSSLNTFLKTIVEGYLSVPWVNGVCGYACSDHASWDSFNIPAAAPKEPVKSPNMHTTRDTIDTVSFKQIQEFAKLATAYSIEIAEPYDFN